MSENDVVSGKGDQDQLHVCVANAVAKGLVLWKPSARFNAFITILDFLVIYEQEAHIFIFHWAYKLCFWSLVKSTS